MRKRLHAKYARFWGMLLAAYAVTLVGLWLKQMWLTQVGGAVVVCWFFYGYHVWRERCLVVDEEKRERVRIEMRAKYGDYSHPA